MGVSPNNFSIYLNNSNFRLVNCVLAHDKESTKMKKLTNFIWALPTVIIMLSTVMIMTLQSCDGGPKTADPVLTLAELQASINTAWNVLWFILVIGGVFAVFIWYQVSQLTKRLKNLGHNV